jgi:hypothetical protein
MKRLGVEAVKAILSRRESLNISLPEAGQRTPRTKKVKFPSKKVD